MVVREGSLDFSATDHCQLRVTNKEMTPKSRGRKGRHHRGRKRDKALLFLTADKFGNRVACSQQTWICYITVEHPEMAGREIEVQKAIEDPNIVSPSTKIPLSSYAFQANPSVTEIRVLVQYDDATLVTTGTTSGNVQTAYPIDSVKYNTPRIGAPIYTRPVEAPAPAAASDKERGGDQ